MSEYNYLFNLASIQLRPYIDANMELLMEDFDNMSYTEALAFVTDMMILDLFRFFESIKYFG